MKKIGTRKSIRKYKKKYTEKIREKIKKNIWQFGKLSEKIRKTSRNFLGKSGKNQMLGKIS